MRREALKEIGGLIDYTLIGNGEKLMEYALVNKIEEYVPET